MNPDLARRLAAVDVTSVDDPKAAWHSLIEHSNEEATLFDRYAIEAGAMGVAVSDLTLEDRQRLGVEFLEWRFPGIEMVGSASGHPVEVVGYRPSWPATFEEWRTRLATAMGATAERIEHVGSTAVPGLAAKPIIDIQVSVPDVDDEGSYVPAIEATGVPLRSRHDEDRYFRPPPDEPRIAQIHVCATGGDWERVHLLFRDYLRADEETRDAYGELKLRLVDEFGDDRVAYTEAKTPFIRDTMQRAATWARSTGWTLDC